MRRIYDTLGFVAFSMIASSPAFAQSTTTFSGGSSSIVTIFNAVANLILSQLGVTLVVIAVALAAAYMMFHGHGSWLWSAVLGGMILLSSAWLVQQLTAGGGGAIGG